MNKDHLMRLAKEESYNSDYSGCGKPRIGCIVALKGAVLARGCNTDKTHTVQERYNIYRYKESNEYLPAKMHAEISALNKVKFLDADFSKIELYIYRELKDGSLAMARPCPSCMKRIINMGIKKIHYTTPEGVATERIGEMKK